MIKWISVKQFSIFPAKLSAKLDKTCDEASIEGNIAILFNQTCIIVYITSLFMMSCIRMCIYLGVELRIFANEFIENCNINLNKLNDINTESSMASPRPPNWKSDNNLKVPIIATEAEAVGHQFHFITFCSNWLSVTTTS